MTSSEFYHVFSSQFASFRHSSLNVPYWWKIYRIKFFFFFLAAVDLICIENISVVIGTQNILQAEFITYLANKTKVPVISFSATRDAVTQ